jgi:hypothetical protein
MDAVSPLRAINKLLIRYTYKQSKRNIVVNVPKMGCPDWNDTAPADAQKTATPKTSTALRKV